MSGFELEGELPDGALAATNPDRTALYLAAAGTPPPDPDGPMDLSDYTDIGWIDDDGITYDSSDEVATFRSWQTQRSITITTAPLRAAPSSVFEFDAQLRRCGECDAPMVSPLPTGWTVRFENPLALGLPKTITPHRADCPRRLAA